MGAVVLPRLLRKTTGSLGANKLCIRLTEGRRNNLTISAALKDPVSLRANIGPDGRLSAKRPRLADEIQMS